MTSGILISRLSMIVRVNVVLNRTVVDSDWGLDNLCSSQFQSFLKITTAQVVETSVTVNNSPTHDCIYPDDLAEPTYEMISGFKPFPVQEYYLPLKVFVRTRHPANMSFPHGVWEYCPLDTGYHHSRHHHHCHQHHHHHHHHHLRHQHHHHPHH